MLGETCKRVKHGENLIPTYASNVKKIQKKKKKILNRQRKTSMVNVARTCSKRNETKNVICCWFARGKILNFIFSKHVVDDGGIDLLREMAETRKSDH